ncbi:MAG: sigma-54 dependent transcriptional regulator [Pseudomonadota bacterium]
MNSLHVLLVDDEEALLRSLARELASLGWQVETAVDSVSAVRALQARDFDALVLDFQLPGPDGVQLLGELDGLSARPVTILLSGHLNVATTVRAVRSGANDVLEKPVSGPQLDARLRELLTDRAAPAPENRAPSGVANSELRKILGETSGMRAVREQMQTAARYPELFLTIMGESGTGKELVAEAIHVLAGTGGRYLPVSLAAIPEHLIEVELFGSESANGQSLRPGLFELAGHGTLFFNEIGDLPASLHPKLLRVIDTRKFRRVGSQVDLPLHARLIAATRRRPSSYDAQAELYDRLSAFTIALPALRDRIPDIALIANHVLAEFASNANAPVLTLTPQAIDALCAHQWPGNVRELEIVLSEAAEAATRPNLSVEEIQAAIRSHGMPAEREFLIETASGTFPTAPPTSEPLRILERRMITDAWQSSGQNLSAAARSLGLPRTTLRDRLKKYGLR